MDNAAAKHNRRLARMGKHAGKASGLVYRVGDRVRVVAVVSVYDGRVGQVVGVLDESGKPGARRYVVDLPEQGGLVFLGRDLNRV